MLNFGRAVSFYFHSMTRNVSVIKYVGNATLLAEGDEDKNINESFYHFSW